MKLKFLDGLRGLAALIVVIDHFAISFFPAATDATATATHGALESVVQYTPAHVLVAGNFAVCIFFILSGIVLSTKFFRTGNQRAVWASAIKRYVRLGLPVIVSVLLAWLLLHVGVFYNDEAAAVSGSNWLANFWHTTPSLWDALRHGVYGVFASGQSDYNTVLWTMRTELFGSFLVFGILLAFGKLRHRWLVYLVLGLLFIKTYYVTFIAGVALSDYYHHRGPEAAPWLRRGGWLPLAAVGLYLGSCPTNTLDGTPFAVIDGRLPLQMSLPVTMHIVGAVALVLAILYSPLLHNILACKPILHLGRVSFGLYLTHLLVLGSLGAFVFTKLAPIMDYRLAFIAMAVPTGLAIWGCAYLFTKLVDEPSITLSGRIYKSYFQPIADRRKIQDSVR